MLDQNMQFPIVRHIFSMVNREVNVTEMASIMTMMIALLSVVTTMLMNNPVLQVQEILVTTTSIKDPLIIIKTSVTSKW